MGGCVCVCVCVYVCAYAHTWMWILFQWEGWGLGIKTKEKKKKKLLEKQHVFPFSESCKCYWNSPWWAIHSKIFTVNVWLSSQAPKAKINPNPTCSMCQGYGTNRKSLSSHLRQTHVQVCKAHLFHQWPKSSYLKNNCIFIKGCGVNCLDSSIVYHYYSLPHTTAGRKMFIPLSDS